MLYEVITSHITVDGDHGRVETRRCIVTNDTDWYANKSKWVGLNTFAMIRITSYNVCYTKLLRGNGKIRFVLLYWVALIVEHRTAVADPAQLLGILGRSVNIGNAVTAIGIDRHLLCLAGFGLGFFHHNLAQAVGVFSYNFV